MLTTNQSFVTYLGNGAATQFPYSFVIPAISDAMVFITNNNVNPPVSTVLSNSQYTITGVGSGNEFAGGSGPGGIVTYPANGSPLPMGWTITIQRVVPYTQPTSLTNQGAFYPQVVEAALDLLTMMCQQLSAQTSGSVPIWAVGPPGPPGQTGGQGIPGIQGIQGLIGPAGSNVPLSYSALVIQNDTSYPTTKIDISASSIAVGGAAYQTLYGVNLVINTAATGANGMDVSALGATAGWVHCYVIYNANTSTAAALGTPTSPLSGNPTLPTGYTQYRYVGSMYWSGSALVLSKQKGDQVIYIGGIQVGTGGTATASQEVVCASAIPPTSTRGYFQIYMASINSSAAVGYLGAYGASTMHQIGVAGLGGAYSNVNDWSDTDSNQNVQVGMSQNLSSAWILSVLGYRVNL